MLALLPSFSLLLANYNEDITLRGDADNKIKPVGLHVDYIKLKCNSITESK